MQNDVDRESNKKSVQSQKQIVSKKEDKEEEIKKQKPSPKKESIIGNLMTSVKSLTGQKPKCNPLLIDEDIEEDQRLQQSPLQEVKARLQANFSVISLPQNLKQEALNMIAHQDNKIQQVFQEIKPDVKVQIIETVQKGGPLSKYYVYTIKGEDMHGRFIIKRKYAQFQSLRKIIAQRWPGSFIPALKNKFDMQNQNQKQVLLKKILVNFLQGLSFSKHIYYKEQVQLFLRSPDIDITQMVEHMPELKVSDLISRFQYAFGQEQKQTEISKISEMNFNFQKKLRKIISKLQIISQKSLQLAQSYDTYTKALKRFGETMRLYEHFSLAEFTQNNREMTLLVKDDDKKIDTIKNILNENVFYEIFGMFEIELIDVRAFLQTVIAIDLYALRKEQIEKEIIETEKTKQQVETGSVNVKTLTSRKPKEEILKNLQQKLQSLYQQKQQVSHIYKIVSITTQKHIIPTFKAIKKNNYFLALGKWMQAGGKQVQQLETVWNFVDDSAQQNITKNC